MGDRYMESDDNKKIIYKDATKLYGHSVAQVSPYDETEMWLGHSDLYMDKLRKFLKTLDDNQIV